MPTTFQWKESSKDSTTFAVCKSASKKSTHRILFIKENSIYIQYMQWNTLDYVSPMGNHMVKKLPCPHHMET